MITKLFMTSSQATSSEFRGKKYFIAALTGGALAILLGNFFGADTDSLVSSLVQISHQVFLYYFHQFYFKSDLKHSLGKASIMLATYASLSFIAEILWEVYEKALNVNHFRH